MKLHVQASEIRLKGEPVCRGVAFGTPHFFAFREESIPEIKIKKEQVDSEIQRYIGAVNRSREDVKRLKSKLIQENVEEGAEILEAHLEMLHDPLIVNQVENTIRKRCKNAESVFETVIDLYLQKFKTIEDPFFRDRMKDIQDIRRRILGHLQSSMPITLSRIAPDSIVFSNELTASDIAEANTSSISAFITEKGGATSHAAILAKAKGIPFVTNISFEKVDFSSIKQVIVDGRTGDVILNPTSQTQEEYLSLRDQLDSYLQKLKLQGDLPIETFDGYRVHLSANVDREHELGLMHLYGGGGVGLFRSEYIFLENNNFPTEEEQYRIYRDLVQKMKGLPIVIRTFDIGGDKFNNQKIVNDRNPFLGCRSLRFLLRERDHFKAQLRAILRASIEGDVSIMFPMISSLSELIESKQILEEAKVELKSEGVKVKKGLRVGCMIEVPSAAVISDLLAGECDFLSIGTNDLVQYSLAIDRVNHTVYRHHTSIDPSVIRLMKLVVTEANRHRIPVSVCGEVAADPRYTPLLLGIGIHELSVASRYLPMIRHAVRSISIVEASHLAEEALKLSCADEISLLMKSAYRQNVPDDCFYNI